MPAAILALHGVGARAFHARELGAFLEGDARGIALQDEHDLAPGALVAVHHGGNGAKVVVAGQVADPRQRAIDAVATTFDGRGLEQQIFDLRKALHRVGQAGAAQAQALHVGLQPLAGQGGVTR